MSFYAELLKETDEISDPVAGFEQPEGKLPRLEELRTQVEKPVEQYEQREIVVDKTGVPRQAGSSHPEGEFIKRLKIEAEKSLFVFAKGIMGRDYLTPHLHLPVCNFVQECPPFRKLLLMPRHHAKTSIVSHCLPPHILLQSAESNIYFPGVDGCECRILLTGETEGMAGKNLRVVESVFTGNATFRALWPERCWEENPRKHNAVWNSQEMTIPRGTVWPDASIKTVGVGGAITGSRPNVLIKDDLISFAAANSSAVMQEAIEWHKVSRALLEEYEKESGLFSLEYTTGTKWAVFDLYSYIIDNDPSVEVLDNRFRAIIKDGRILWPERFNEKNIEQLRKEYGSMFFLLYLNSAADPSLTDFDTRLIRCYAYKDGNIMFDEDERDVYLEERLEAEAGKEEEAQARAIVTKGMKFGTENYSEIVGKGRGEWFRLKYS